MQAQPSPHWPELPRCDLASRALDASFAARAAAAGDLALISHSGAVEAGPPGLLTLKSSGARGVSGGDGCSLLRRRQQGVVLNQEDLPDFSLLQQALGGRGGKRVAPEVSLYAFDLLYLDGRDLRQDPLDDRRTALAGALSDAASDGPIRLFEEVHSDGPTFFRHACEMGLEGIVAKDRRKPYRSGRGGDWLKLKCVQSEGFAIVVYELSDVALGRLGRVLVAAYEGERLVYVGGVGTGSTGATAPALRKRLDAIRRDKPAVALKRQSVVWTEPTLVAAVEFRAWTEHGKLRHPSATYALRQRRQFDDRSGSTRQMSVDFGALRSRCQAGGLWLLQATVKSLTSSTEGDDEL